MANCADDINSITDRVLAAVAVGGIAVSAWLQDSDLYQDESAIPVSRIARRSHICAASVFMRGCHAIR
jgi:hypothetical protein